MGDALRPTVSSRTNGNSPRWVKRGYHYSLTTMTHKSNLANSSLVNSKTRNNSKSLFKSKKNGSKYFSKVSAASIRLYNSNYTSRFFSSKLLHLVERSLSVIRDRIGRANVRYTRIICLIRVIDEHSDTSGC